VVGERRGGVSTTEHVDPAGEDDGRVPAPRSRERRRLAPAPRHDIEHSDLGGGGVRNTAEAADDVDTAADRDGHGSVERAAWKRRLALPALSVEAVDAGRGGAAENVDRTGGDDHCVGGARCRERRRLRPPAGA
jgi:hypothetical protein